MVQYVEFGSMRKCALHLPPNTHEQNRRHRQDDRRAYSEDEEPPEHPHNLFRIADGAGRPFVGESARKKPSALSSFSPTYPSTGGASRDWPW